MPRLALIATLLLALGLAACGGDDGEGAGGGSEAAGAGTQGEGEAAETQADDGCAAVEQPPAKSAGGAEKPSEKLDARGTYEVTVRTSCGDFTIRLDQRTSPETTASFVALAESGFYDDTWFHRIVPGFVLQGGDPTGTGTGGPGYQTVDEPPADASYVRGVVAMAKAGDEAAGTAGSQFFVVTGEDAGLPPHYALLGEVSSGMDVVERIGRHGDATDPEGSATRTIVIEDMEITGP